MRTQYTELVVVEKGVELVAEEMVAEKEGWWWRRQKGRRGGVGGAIGGGGAALLRQYENVSVTSALFEHDPGFVAVMRKVLPVARITLELSAYGKPEHLLAILSWLLRPW